MGGEKLVGDLQVPVEECFLLPADIPISNAIAKLQRSAYRSFPCHPVLVLNQRREPVGVLSVRDLTARKDLVFLQGKVISFVQSARALRGSPIKRRIRVAQVMRPIRLTAVSASATLAEATQKMVRHQVQFLPVLENGLVTGVISAHRILREAADIMTGKQDPNHRGAEGVKAADTVL